MVRQIDAPFASVIRPCARSPPKRRKAAPRIWSTSTANRPAGWASRCRASPTRSTTPSVSGRFPPSTARPTSIASSWRRSRATSRTRLRLRKLYVTGSSTLNGTAATVANTATGNYQYQYEGDAERRDRCNQVPLAAFARFGNMSAPLAIAHQEQFPSVTISFDLAPGDRFATPSRHPRGAESEIGMPASVTGSYSGDAAEFANRWPASPG